jgi:hypothetical protein
VKFPVIFFTGVASATQLRLVSAILADERSHELLRSVDNFVAINVQLGWILLVGSDAIKCMLVVARGINDRALGFAFPRTDQGLGPWRLLWPGRGKKEKYRGGSKE